ncbi:MAG: PIN domain-containing protein [Actinomycetota bacterium]
MVTPAIHVTRTVNPARGHTLPQVLLHPKDANVLAIYDAEFRSSPIPASGGGEVGRAGISDLGIGYSAPDAAEWDRLMEALEVFELVETTGDHLRRARQVQSLLAARRQRGRKLPDRLIAAAAETRGLLVLHYDADFDRIAAVTGPPAPVA